MPHELPFASLSEDAAAAVRERQLRRKQAKLERKQQSRVARASSIHNESTSGSYSDWISKAQYFEAVPAGLTTGPNQCRRASFKTFQKRLQDFPETFSRLSRKSSIFISFIVKYDKSHL